MSYLGKPPSVPSGTREMYEFTSVEGQSKFTGVDNNGRVLDYDPGYINVSVQGTLISNNDYSALDGTSVLINAPLPAGLLVQVEAFGTFGIANVYSKLDIDTFLAGKVSTELPLLTDFKKHNKSGLYKAYGDGAGSLATPNAPLKSNNSFLTVCVLSDGNFTHYTATQNHSTTPVIWNGNYYGESGGVSGSGIIKWTREMNDKDAPAGVPQPWPLSTPPEGWIICNGQAFSPTNYPELALAYPSATLPDLRGEFIRGWDNGRGVDSGRSILSSQGDAIRNITGQISPNLNGGTSATWVGTDTGQAGGALLPRSNSINVLSLPNTVTTGNGGISFDASRVVPTASENRPRNIAFNYIVRAR